MRTVRGLARDRSVTRRRVARSTWRRVTGYARPYRWRIAVFLALTVASAALVVVPPLLLQQIVDRGIAGGDRRLVLVLAAAALGVAVVQAGVSLVVRWFSSTIGEGLIYDLRTQVFAHVQRQPVAFFTRTQTGALVTRLNSDVIGAQQAFTNVLSGVVSNLVSVGVVLATMLVLSWQITLAALVLTPLFYVPARWVGTRLQLLTREAFDLNAQLGNRMTERFTVSGALLVKLMGRPGTEQSEYAGRAGRVRDIGIRIALVNRVLLVSLTLLAAVATALTYGIGGLLAIQGTLTVGTLLALSTLLAQLFGPLTALSNARVDVMTALVSFERVFEVLDLRPLVEEPRDGAALPRGALEVRFEDVTFRYPGRDEISLPSLEGVRVDERPAVDDVLHGVTFTAPAGATVALVGPSGAGKTTITGLVSRLYDPQRGRVLLGGTDVRELSFRALRDGVGVVTQDAHLFHDTLRANLAFAAPDASETEMRRALADAAVLDLVDSLPDGLDTVVGDRGHRLSGGEKQRVAIARLLLRDPGVVVLDEATAHLDSESERRVQEALERTLEGRTALVVAHRLSTVRRADLVVVVADGRVAETGTHGELVAAGGRYAALYRTQFGLSDDPSDDRGPVTAAG
ncbi:MAG: ABC transporter ATP-binding protein [Kineosporiaceae bacterium]